MKTISATEFFISVLLLSLSAFGAPAWDEQLARSEKVTADYQARHPNVRSDRFVFKTVTLPDGTRLELDLRIERSNAGEKSSPVVFFVHGGGWISGTKAHFCHQSTAKEKKAASAIYNLKQPPPDTFLYHGTEDQTIEIDVARRFAEAIRKKGGNARLLVYEGVGHSFFGKEPYLSATTRALIDHTSHVFGLTDKQPELSDYALPPKIAEMPDGFSLPGKWQSDKGKSVMFFANSTVDYAGGRKLRWVESFGNLYIVWASGHYGRINIADDIADANTISIGKQTLRKSSKQGK